MRQDPLRLWNCVAVALCALGATMATAYAGGPAAFTEEAVARGLVYDIPFGYQQFGTGVALVDLDGDLDPDAVVAGRADGVVGIFENDGTGHFTDHSDVSGVPAIGAPSSISAADYDADGDLDLFIACKLEPNVMLRNDGGFTFTDVSLASGLADPGSGMGAAWADWDGDGWVDLYVPNRTSPFGSQIPNRMYANNGNGTFTEVGETLGVDRGMDPTFVVAFFDYDRDGDADLYLGNDRGTSPDWQNHLFQNDGTGLFTDVSTSSGTGVNVDAMGIAIGDLHHTGWQDIYVTNTPPGNVLLMNQGDGTFADESLVAGVGSYGVGWSTLFFDYDNDTWLEIHVCDTLQPDRLYDHDGTWPATNDAVLLGVANTDPAYCAAAGDVDGDGDLDLLHMSAVQPIRLFINNEGDQREWIKLDVRGRGNNTFAIGAQVDLRTGTVEQMREVRAGTSFKSQNELVVHFGLGSAIVADEITVTWPGGVVSRTLLGMAAGTTWTVYPPEALGDADEDDDVELDDFFALLDCRDAGVVTPGCEMMDFDGDADVDDDDVDAFLLVYTGPTDDCNANGTMDLVEIAADPDLDANQDGELDSCACPADIDGSGAVNFADLTALLGGWGPCAPEPAPCPVDIDHNGIAGFSDLSLLLGTWGPCE